ncbi:MAG: 2Fe-2S iron-sulfur cluster-binding protein [archaeon]
MAKVIYNNQVEEIEDNSKITEACEKLGVPFGCYAGVCHACKIKIKEGMQNLSVLTENEKNANLDKNERLACQCTIKKGSIKIQI